MRLADRCAENKVQRIWPHHDGNAPISRSSGFAEHEERLLFEVVQLLVDFVVDAAVVPLFRRRWRHFRWPTTSGARVRRCGVTACEWRRNRKWKRKAVAQRRENVAGHVDSWKLAERSPPWRHYDVVYKTRNTHRHTIISRRRCSSSND